MQKKVLINLIFWILICAIIIACVYMIFLLRSETTQCIKNAFVYGADKQIKGSVSCTCEVQNEGQYLIFKFNETDWWSEPTENLMFSLQN